MITPGKYFSKVADSGGTSRPISAFLKFRSKKFVFSTEKKL